MRKKTHCKNQVKFSHSTRALVWNTIKFGSMFPLMHCENVMPLFIFEGVLNKKIWNNKRSLSISIPLLLCFGCIVPVFLLKTFFRYLFRCLELFIWGITAFIKRKRNLFHSQHENYILLNNNSLNTVNEPSNWSIWGSCCCVCVKYAFWIFFDIFLNQKIIKSTQ